MGKTILLTVPDDIYSALKKRAKAQMTTVQEVIRETLVRSVLAQKKKGGESEEQFLKYFSRKR